MFEKFIEENIKRDIKNFVSFSDLRERYLKFCKFYQIKPISKMKFSHDLGKYGVGIRGNKTINYYQISGRHCIGLLPCKY
jgi:hypothetical protein